MRCVYHGWKYGLDGQCLEMPSEPAESGFAGQGEAHGLPVRGAGRGHLGLHGAGEPAARRCPISSSRSCRRRNVFISKRVQDCNWFQAMEGGIDSSHISFLHAPIDHRDAEVTRGIDRASFGVGAAVETGDRAPRFDVADTEYGVVIGARRAQPDGRWYWRITQFLMPFYTMPPTDVDEKIVQSHIWVPMDDTHLVNWMVTWHPERALTDEEIALNVAGQGRARLRLLARHLGALRRHAHRGQPGQRLLDGLGGAPHAHVLRHPGLRRAGPGRPGEPGDIVDRTPRAIGLERHRHHPGAPAPHDGGPRAARSGHAGPRAATRGPSSCGRPPSC